MCKDIGPDPLVSFKFLSHRYNVASPSLLYNFHVDFSDGLSDLMFRLLEFNFSNILAPQIIRLRAYNLNCIKSLNRDSSIVS